MSQPIPVTCKCGKFWYYLPYTMVRCPRCGLKPDWVGEEEEDEIVDETQ